MYNRKQVDTNPLRDILKQNPDKSNTPDGQKYFENMSEAYASLCSEYAWVMSNTLPNVNEKGIWGQIEKPTLQKTGNVGGQVDTVSFFSPREAPKKIYDADSDADRCLR